MTTFNVAAEAYDRFMGRFSQPLAPTFADYAGIRAGMKVLDVGSGPGALTTELARRVGPANVAAVEPSEPFVAAVRSRLPGVDVRPGSAEKLPHPDGAFDAALAQLVVHFMKDPVGGIREMARVTRAGGTVAACVWDHAGERSPIALLWRAANDVDPGAHDESDLAGTRGGHLADLFRSAGLNDVQGGELQVHVTLSGFDEWWAPFGLGVGPAGSYVKSLSPERLERVRARAREMVGDGPVTIEAAAWAARGTV